MPFVDSAKALELQQDFRIISIGPDVFLDLQTSFGLGERAFRHLGCLAVVRLFSVGDSLVKFASISQMVSSGHSRLHTGIWL